MPKYTVFESINMGGTHYAERIFDCVATEDIENGTFGYMDGLADGFSHIYKFVKGTKDGEKVVVASQPAWSEDECRISNQRRDKFIIPAGTPFRVYVVKVNDEFGITIEGITAGTQSVVANQTNFAGNDVFLTIGEDGKLVASDSSTEDAVMEARVMRKRIVGGTLVTAAHNYGYSNAMYEARIKVLA